MHPPALARNTSVLGPFTTFTHSIYAITVLIYNLMCSPHSLFVFIFVKDGPA